MSHRERTKISPEALAKRKDEVKTALKALMNLLPGFGGLGSYPLESGDVVDLPHIDPHNGRTYLGNGARKVTPQRGSQ